MHTIRLVLPFFIFLFLFLTPAFATIINIDPSQETYVSQRFPTANYSTVCTFQIKTGPSNEWTFAYFKFNISDIPVNATINSAYISTWQTYSNLGTDRTVEAWNTSQNWTMYNITWNAKHDVSVSQSNTTGVDYTKSSVTVGRKNFTVTNAIKAAYAKGDSTVSLALRDSVNASATIYYGDFGKLLCYEPNHEFLAVNYSLIDCSSDCGACGCNAAGDDCYSPPIVGSYCNIDGGQPNTIKTVTSSCGYSYLDCPNGTYCTQISPLVNMSVYPTTPGSANLPYCHQCIFMNMKVASYFGASTYHWVNVWTNCPNNPECNCLGWLCSNNIYEAPTITDVPYNVTQWAAGCFNPSSGYFVNITNGTGSQTTIDDLVNESCGSACSLGNNTPQTVCPVNTTTTCYDSACNPVSCGVVVPTTCSSNYGGQIALQIGALMGITDCGLSQWVLSMLLSISVGFGVLYYGRDKQIGINGFVIGTLGMLIMFTLIGWFPSWVMIIFIVISAYLMAKGIGLGGG